MIAVNQVKIHGKSLNSMALQETALNYIFIENCPLQQPMYKTNALQGPSILGNI